MSPNTLMARGVSYLVAVTMLLAFATTVASAQTSSLSGVVTDSAGGVVPGATVTVLNDATKATLESVTNPQGQFSFPALADRQLYGHRLADRLQDVRRQQRAPDQRPAGQRHRDARGRLVDREGRSQVGERTGADAVGTGRVDAEHRPVEGDPAQFAERALRGGAVARRLDDRRPPRRDHQRPREQHGERHDRRRGHRERAAVDRRVLLDDHPAPRRGRRGQRHRRGPHGQRGPRVGAGPVHDQIRLEPGGRQRLPLLAAAGVQLELLLQQAQRPAAQRSHRSSVPASARAGRSSSPASTTAVARRSSSSTSNACISRRARPARARCCDPKPSRGSSVTS